jgi:Nif-specific regulatory protein
VAGSGGRWIALAEAGSRRALPAELLADTLDRETAGGQDSWVAAPLLAWTSAAEAIVLHTAAGEESQHALAMLRELAAVIGTGLASARARQRDRQQVRHLETILSISQEWNRTREVQPLLIQIAEAATRLVDADRASIFLWDRRAHVLVARPALGVKGGELRVPDDRGVVGQVVQTGRPCRADAATEPDKIDRQVDGQLGYRTRTLLCVPLRGKSGELFGAFELVNKQSGSFTAEDEAVLVDLAAHAAIALENAQDRELLLFTNRQIADQAAQQVRLIGEGPKMEALRSMIRRVADTDLAVLILGENGTGKELVAQSIHYLSRRRDKPFVAVNCAGIPDTLAESELFGHEKGAFTDARETRQGKFELAAMGTLLLDEIGDLSLSGQAKLLRVLEEKVLVRVGGSTTIATDARVVAATNQNLAEMVRQKRFREDLYFRLNVVTLEIPPLRDRPQDVLLLAEHFLEDFSRRARRKLPEFTVAAKERLQKHPWPGNVRELRNLMERLAYLTTEDVIDASDLAFTLSPRSGEPLFAAVDQSLSEATAQFQIEYIHRAIEQTGGSMSQAASRLGLHRSNLYRKMRQLDMTLPEE